MKKILALTLVCLTGFTNVALAGRMDAAKLTFQFMKQQGFKFSSKMEDTLTSLKENKNVTVEQAQALRQFVISRMKLHMDNAGSMENYDMTALAKAEELIDGLTRAIIGHRNGAPITLPEGATTIFRESFSEISTKVNTFTFRGGEAQKAAEAIANFGKPAATEVPKTLMEKIGEATVIGVGVTAVGTGRSSLHNRILDKSAVMPASTSAGKGGLEVIVGKK